MVEDAGLFQLLEESFIRRTGCEILRAADCRQMLERARRYGPDIILVDPSRLGEGGLSCLREIKSDPSLRSTPVLAVAAAPEIAACRAAGADATLERPVTREVLERELCSLARVAHRDGARRSARLRAQVASSRGEQRGRVKDISRSGLFVSLPEPPPVAAPVILSLRLPGDKGRRSVRARGVVVRQVEDRPGSHLIGGVGVRFVQLDAATESLIDHFVEQAILGEDPLESEPGGRSDA